MRNKSLLIATLLSGLGSFSFLGGQHHIRTDSKVHSYEQPTGRSRTPGKPNSRPGFKHTRGPAGCLGMSDYSAASLSGIRAGAQKKMRSCRC